MKQFCLLLFSIIIPISATAQAGSSIQGSVSANNDEPLAGAHIILHDTDLGAATTASGTFEINNIPSGSYTLTISHIGYQTVRRAVEVAEGIAYEYEFTLDRSHGMPQIEVIGERPGRFERIPGSAGTVSRQVIAQAAPVSGHEVFRKISGIHAVDEEGIGLRANIGIRGLDPGRSRTVLMMEDGIPVALAPYGEPEMYYTPSMDRMAGLEVIKGSGSILFGPQTFGGVVNYITADPPAEQTGEIHLRGGEGGFFVGKLGMGNTVGNTGYQINYLRKQGDEVGLLDFGLHDLNAKIKLVSGERSVVGIKLGLYDETSNSTYVGLSQAMYDAGELDFTPLAPNDVLAIRRYSLSATHDFFINDDISLKTTAFGYTTTRNWARQEFDNVAQAGVEYDHIIGDPDAEYGALFFHDITGNRNREFEVAGIEPRLSANFDFAGIHNELDAGVRFLYERAFEQRINGTAARPTTGELRDDEIRTGYAFSAFLQNRFHLNENLSVTPGLRLENFVYERNILLANFAEQDILTTDRLTEILPGIGVNYHYSPGSSVYAGIHRGFGPPRIKDAISAAGQSEQLNAEKSWNYEVGTRTRLIEGVDVELTGFYLDFSNQIIPVAESAGGTGAPGVGLVNGGSTQHLGLEAGLHLDIGHLLNSQYGVTLSSSATFTKAEFSESRYVADGSETVNVKGNQLPYAPEFLYSGSLNITAPFGGRIGLTGTYTGSQFTDALNSVTGSRDGRSGEMDAYFLLDLTAGYQIPVIPGASVSLSVKNMLNERYIASRRPQGIRVGLPRFVSAGIDLNF